MQDKFLRNAYEMAYSREILGVHYPSDAVAGQAFARQFIDLLLKNKAFRKDLELVRAEMEKLINIKP
jgi:acid phosphatase (class A)